MTRRGLSLGTVAASGETKSGFAETANRFHALWKAWAGRWNAQKPGTVDLAEVWACAPLPEAWRRVERERRKLLMGGR